MNPTRNFHPLVRVECGEVHSGHKLYVTCCAAADPANNSVNTAIANATKTNRKFTFFSIAFSFPIVLGLCLTLSTQIVCFSFGQPMRADFVPDAIAPNLSVVFRSPEFSLPHSCLAVCKTREEGRIAQVLQTTPGPDRFNPIVTKTG